MKKCFLTKRINIILSYYLHEIELKGILYVKSLPIYVLVVGYIALLAYLTNKPIEAFFQVCAFLFLRYKFNTTYHAPNTALCVFITLCAISYAIPSTPRLTVMLFGGIGTAFVVCFVAYIAQVVVDERKPKRFDIATCSREDFIKRCREVKMTKDCTDIALAYFYDKSMKIWDIAREYSIDYDSAKRKVNRIKHKLID